MYAIENLSILPAHFVTVFLISIVCLSMKMSRPKFSDKFYGYKTRLSLKNETNWNEANRYCANLSFIVGIIFVTMDTLCYFFLKGPVSLIIPLFIFGILVIGLMVLVEIHLARFDKKLLNKIK